MPILNRLPFTPLLPAHFLRQTLTTCVLSLLSGSLLAQVGDIKLGVVLDQSSLAADVGRDYLAGARTYFDHINTQGGVNGRKITVLVKDDEGDTKKTVELTKQLIEADRVDALFGYVGDAGIAALAEDRSFKNARIALYAPLSGEAVSKVPDTIFYVRPTYRDEARYIVNHFSRLGSSRFAVVASATDFGNKLTQNIEGELAERKLPAAGKLVINNDLKNLEAVVKSLAQLGPQVVMVAADTITMAEFLKQFRKLDKGTSVVGFSTVNHRTLLELAKREFAASTMLTQVVPHPDLPATRVQAEHLTLMAKYREEPPSHVTLEGFLAAKAMVTALSRAGSVTRASVLASVSGDRRVDVGGITLVFTATNDRGSNFVDLAFLRRDGRLVQ
jgi:branched-chain amino acid transport system substrate-binding protein